MLNHTDIMGRLTRDPEVKTTPSGASVCNFTIACDRDFVDKATNNRECDFIDVVAWNGLADFISKWWSKGKMIVLSGRIQTRKYTDKNGNNRVAVELKADSAYFCESKKSDSAQTSQDFQATPDSAPAQTTQDFPEIPADDGSLPF